MDTLERYREIVRDVIREYASYKPSNGEIETEAIVDPEKDHYEVMHVGWDGPRRVHGSVIHIDIIGDKIWIQYDGTNRPVAEELVAAGIPREAIVLAFHPPFVRPHTGFATGAPEPAGTGPS
jgi:XisI protein